MSNRDSLGFGDLIPQDVVDIFAQEKHGKRGRKKRSHSLGRALGWLKGKKRKDLGGKGQNLGLGPALDLALDGHPAGHQGGHRGGQKSGRQAHPQGNGHAAPKRDDDDKNPEPPLFQENVFIEASRPKYLENLHSEALEGLKMMQQEESNNGVEYQDNESTVSTITVQTDGEGGGFMTDSTIADTTSVVSVQSSISTRSSRSGLTRQGSTFRPLNSGKKSEKSKTRRRHRKTVASIPYHVQRELGLDRVGWTVTQRLDEEQLYNGDTDNSPTTDGPQQVAESQKGAGSNQQDQLTQLGATHAGHRDDLALLHCLGPDLPGEQRPRSLAVPWLTTANSLQQEMHKPPSPVMSMSPQAAYMSKIIPNAVLPPSIDVVEISRGRSRNSVRTVSKSSLLLSSPAPSRASSRASSTRTTSSRGSTITSASRYNPPNLSDSSCWSNSDSSETLVSDSSTISSSSTPKQKRSKDGHGSAKEDKTSAQSSVDNASKYSSNGKLIIKGDEVKKEGPFVRSLSVMKPKRAPPPPNRSYSLHNKVKRRSRDLAEVKIITGESFLQRIPTSGEENEKNKSGSPPTKAIDSPGYNADTSSLDDSTGSVSVSPLKLQLQALKAEEAAKVEVSKEASPEKQEVLQENKLSKIVSPSSGYSSQDGTSAQLPKLPHSSSPRHKRGILAKLQRLFPGSTPATSIPPTALQPEDPENTKSTEDFKSDTSVETASVSPSVRTLRDLFNIPPHPKVHAPPPPPPEVWAHNKRTFELLLGPPAPDNAYAIIKKNPKDRRQQRKSPSASTESSVKSLVLERKQKNPAMTVESVNQSPLLGRSQESGIVTAEIHRESSDRLVENENVDLKGNRKVTEKDEKVRVSDILNGMLLKAVERREERLGTVREEARRTTVQSTDSKKDTLTAISVVRIPAFPSLPSVHNPPQPHKNQFPVVVSPESSWPPPPSPMGGTDELDFPLPPPPMFSEEGLVIPVQVPPDRSTQPLNIPPPPPYTAPPPPLEAVPPPTHKKVSPPPPKEVSPPQPKHVFPPPPIEFSLPPAKEVFSQPPKLISPPIEVFSLAPEEIPPPPPKQVLLPPVPEEVTPPQPQQVSPHLVHEAQPQLVQNISSTLVTVVSTTPAKEVSPPLVIEVCPLPPKEASTLSTEDVPPPSSQEKAHQSSDEAAPVSKLGPPQSIPPPPPLPSQPQSSQQEISSPQENVPSESETNTVSFNSILTPPQSIPPPPPIQLLHPPQVAPPIADSPETQEASDSPPSEVPVSTEKPKEPVIIPLPPPLPEQGLASIKNHPSPASTESQTPEPTSAPVVQEEPTPIVTPSLLQTVKLRSVNSSPEPPKAQEQPEVEVTLRKRQPSNQVPTSSTSTEAPQKPIRRSLIMMSPAPSSPPATVASQPALPKSQSLVIPPLSTSLSPTKKSPPAMTTSPSMNLQEAIRLRTAAISKGGPASRLSLHSPTSPIDLNKSPSSTASFIFSKSNKKVVIDTKRLDVSPVATTVSEAESAKKGVIKVPPPVAKKPKSKGKETESGEGTEQTAGQEELQDGIEDAAEKTNGTAGSVEGGGTPSA